jgi:ABC-type lipoprotein release transport system permease subunit
LRAFLTVGSVSIGVAAIIFLVSLGFGLERLVTKQVANFEAFTILDIPSANLKTGKINKEAIDRISSVPHITSIDEVVDLAGRIRLSSQDSTTETVVVAANPNFFKLSELVVDNGKTYGKESTNELVINKVLAGLLGFNNASDAINKKISLDVIVSSDLRAKDDVDGPITKTLKDFQIVGVTSDSQSPIAFIPLNVAISNGVINRTSIKLKIDDQSNIENVRKAVENAGFSTEYVGDTVKQIGQIFSLFRIILGSFGAIALAVAALGTFNTLTISLMERIREVALLKTLGMNKKGIFKLFVTESFTIGTMGGIFGILLGSAIGWALNRFLAYLALQAGADQITVYFSPPFFIFTVAIGSLIVGFITGLYPAYRAVKVSPLDAIRYE